MLHAISRDDKAAHFLPVLLSAGQPDAIPNIEVRGKEKMGSKVIFDSPALLEESLVSLTEAPTHMRVPCSQATLQRYMRRGSRDAILESVLICGRRYTSKEAIERFLRGQLKVEHDRPAPVRGSKTKKEIDAAARRFGLPEPLGTKLQKDRA